MAEPGVETRTRSSVITARAAATFDPVGRSVATARAFVRDTLQGWGYADVVDDAVVLTSELVTNAVIHAGTSADVLCLRTEDGVRVEVADRYPEREIPIQGAGRSFANADRENGRGLLLCAALASRWGVEYTSTYKQVWFQLDLPQRPVGTRSAGPVLPTSLLPVADERVRVAVIQIDRSAAVVNWNEDAEHIFGYAADQVIGKPLPDIAAWPHTPGLGTGIVEALQLSRWEGSYGIRGADGRVIPVYASHLRVRDTHGEPSTVCLLVRDYERAVIQTPLRAPSEAGAESRTTDPFEVFIGSPPPKISTDSSSARWSAPATCSTATRPFCCSPRTTRRSWRYGPPPGSPPPASASHASPWRRVPDGTAPHACPPSTTTSRPSRAPSRCSTTPGCAPS